MKELFRISNEKVKIIMLEKSEESNISFKSMNWEVKRSLKDRKFYISLYKEGKGCIYEETTNYYEDACNMLIDLINKYITDDNIRLSLLFLVESTIDGNR